MNSERVALTRRLQDDDQWVVPHNIFLAVYGNSTCNVLAFDPHPKVSIIKRQCRMRLLP